MTWKCIPEVRSNREKRFRACHGMKVLRGGTHIENDEEERSARVGTYFGMMDAR